MDSEHNTTSSEKEQDQEGATVVHDQDHGTGGALNTRPLGQPPEVCLSTHITQS